MWRRTENCGNSAVTVHRGRLPLSLRRVYPMVQTVRQTWDSPVDSHCGRCPRCAGRAGSFPRRGAERGRFHGPDCSFDHGHSAVAHHGGRCPCCAVSQFSSADVEETVELPWLHWLWFSSCGAAHHRLDELMGEFLVALHTGAGPGVVSTGTRPP